MVRDLASGAHTKITIVAEGDALPAAADEWVAWISRDGLETVVKIWDGNGTHVLGAASYAQPVIEDGIVGWISDDDEVRRYVGRPGTGAAAATVGHTVDNRDLELSRGRMTWLGVNGTLRDDVFVDDVDGSGVFAVAVSPTLPWGGLESDLGDLVWTGGATQDHVWYRRTLGLTRLAGQTRYETAVAISQNAYPQGARTAVLATGENYPDALCGVPLAAAFDAPLLLTRSSFLNDSTAGELERLGVDRVVILGQTGAVSDDIRRTLESRFGGSVVVERIGGPTRFETAELIAQRFRAERPVPWTNDETVVLATGQNFPDALAAGPLAASMGWPILLVTDAGTPAPTRRAVDDLRFAHSILTGGESVMPPSVQAEMPDPVRLGGEDRFETAQRIAEHSLAEGWLESDEVCLATGWLFPDALTGGVLGGLRAAPLVLTSGQEIRPASLATLQELAQRCMRANVFGGEGAVTAAAETQAFHALLGDS
jgi:putative cell wall-binding protein